MLKKKKEERKKETNRERVRKRKKRVARQGRSNTESFDKRIGLGDDGMSMALAERVY